MVPCLSVAVIAFQNRQNRVGVLYSAACADYCKALQINVARNKRKGVSKDSFTIGVPSMDWTSMKPCDSFFRMLVFHPRGGVMTINCLFFCAWFQLDKSRYNMKETKLAKVYTEALGLSRNSLDAYNLLKFKQPSIGSSFKYAVSLSFSSVSSFYIYLAVRRKRLATFPRLHTTSSQVVRQYRNQHRRFMM